MVALRDRSHLLQEEVSLRMADQTNRNLQVLAIVTTVFLPASLIAAIFGMNVGGLPLVADRAGFVWVLLLLVGVSAFVFWLLKRSGILDARAHSSGLLDAAAELAGGQAGRQRIQQKQGAQDRRLDHAALPPLNPLNDRLGGLFGREHRRERIRFRHVLAAAGIVLPIRSSTSPSTTSVTVIWSAADRREATL